MVTSLGQLATAVLMLGAPAVLTRWGHARSFVGAAIFLGLSIVPIALIAHWLAAGLSVIGIAFLMAFGSTALTLFHQELVRPGWRAAMSGASMMTMGFGWGLVASGGGFFISAWGWTAFFLTAALLTACAAAAFWLYFVRNGKTRGCRDPFLWGDKTMIDIPIRYYRDYAGAYDYGYETLGLPLDECALLVVDVDGTSPNPTTEGMIAPALHAARASGMRVAYVHNDLRLVANRGNIVGEVWGRTKGNFRRCAGRLAQQRIVRTGVSRLRKTAGRRAQLPQVDLERLSRHFFRSVSAQLRRSHALCRGLQPPRLLALHLRRSGRAQLPRYPAARLFQRTR